MRFCFFALVAFLTLLTINDSMTHPAITVNGGGKHVGWEFSSDYSGSMEHHTDHPSVYTDTTAQLGGKMMRQERRRRCIQWTAFARGSVNAVTMENSVGDLVVPYGYYTLVCGVFIDEGNKKKWLIGGFRGEERDVLYEGYLHRWSTTFPVTITFCNEDKLYAKATAKINNLATVSSIHGGEKFAECSADE